MHRDECMSAPRSVQVYLALPEAEAWALAQFLKRASLTDYRQRAQSDEEADAMRDGAERIRDALADAGIAPR